MLYVTTRGNQDAFTAYRTLHQDYGPDGGFFVPMRMPVLERKDILLLKEQSFGQNVANILNLFFGTKLSSWDVDVAVGKNIAAFQPVGHRTLVAELWHRMDGNLGSVISRLAGILPDGDKVKKPTDWVCIAVRIAVLFAAFGEMMKSGQLRMDKPIDVAVPSGSFAAPMAVWYAREMGLPVHHIICGCNENGAVWELLHRGSLDTAAIAVNTTTPDADYAIPPDLERLVHGTMGTEEALRYWWSRSEGACYTPPEALRESLSKGMFAAVVSRMRVENVIRSVYSTNQYVLDLYSALAYGALSDYRSSTGAFRTALVLMEKNPLTYVETVAECLQISVQELKQRLSGR